MKYEIIYADPPWSFSSRMGIGKINYNAVKRVDDSIGGYPTLSTPQICEFDVAAIAAENCVLFIWTTSAHLEQCFSVINVWGFKYKTVGFVWVKTKHDGSLAANYGTWTLPGMELCLLATRGKCFAMKRSHKVRQVVLTKHHKEWHSKKPDEVRKRIVELFGDRPRIELFARTEIQGWDCFSNEIGPSDS